MLEVEGIDVLGLFRKVVKGQEKGKDVGGNVWFNARDVSRFGQGLQICAIHTRLLVRAIRPESNPNIPQFTEDRPPKIIVIR